MLGGVSGDPEIIDYSCCGVWAEDIKASSSLNPICPCLRFLAHTTLSAKDTNTHLPLLHSSRHGLNLISQAST